MPTTKLTLTVKPEVVKMAKQYARRHNTSVSATFSRVIRALVGREQNQAVAVPSGSALEKLSASSRSLKARPRTTSCSRPWPRSMGWRKSRGGPIEASL